MGAFRIKFTGQRALLRKLDAAARKLQADSTGAVDDEGKAVFDKSQSRVPRVSGKLAGSGKVETTTEGDSVTSTITYGDETVDYAATVHEGPHSVNRKFLEIPLRESEAGMASRIAAKVKL